MELEYMLVASETESFQRSAPLKYFHVELRRNSSSEATTTCRGEGERVIKSARSAYFILLRRRRINQKGISLVEVLVASVIFSVAALGMFSTLSMMRVSSDVSDKKLGAAYFGRQVLEELRAKVDQRSYNDPGSLLSIGNHTYVNTNPQSPYTATYTVTLDPTGARKVDLSVSWTE